MTKLKGMTWNHLRGIAPLEMATKEFKKIHPDVEITWDARTLKDFEDYPISLLANNYDIMLIDHPFIGTGVKEKVIVPLNDWLPGEFLRDQEVNSVGKSYESYTWDKKQWGLAVDAASQVAAYRADMINQLSINIPKTWDEVLNFMDELPSKYQVGMPLNPTHSYCVFLTLCINIGGETFWSEGGIDEQIAEEALYFLKGKLLPKLHEGSTNMNPIDMFEEMSRNNEIIYVPLIYGYVPYSRESYAEHIIHFTDIPSNFSEPKGSILGGVGMAMSSYSQHKQLVAQFMQLVASEEFQKGLYFTSGGQPGHRKAWEDSEVNRLSNDFFKNTLKTLDHAYLRPRFFGYSHFQETAGIMINNYLKSGGNVKNIIKKLNLTYKEKAPLA